LLGRIIIDSRKGSYFLKGIPPVIESRVRGDPFYWIPAYADVRRNDEDLSDALHALAPLFSASLVRMVECRIDVPVCRTTISYGENSEPEGTHRATYQGR